MAKDEIEDGPFPKLALLRQERARAMEAWVRLEQSLSDLFAALLAVGPIDAGTVYFKITNPSAAFKIIEVLLKRRFGNQFRAHWHGDKRNNKGLFTHLGSLSVCRNELAHWGVVNFLGGASRTMPGPEAGLWRLEPPNWWDIGPDKPFRTTEDIQEFTAKADYVQHCIFIFMGLNFPPYLAEAVRPSWQGIFEQPFLYPPPTDHPAYFRWRKRQNPLPPFHL